MDLIDLNALRMLENVLYKKYIGTYFVFLIIFSIILRLKKQQILLIFSNA